ncbi:Nonribosomal peptide synthase [Paramyrothecium foliicola]|nr:Nonribosomal peptide synthase [Paramyrothecium foliicola]
MHMIDGEGPGGTRAYDRLDEVSVKATPTPANPAQTSEAQATDSHQDDAIASETVNDHTTSLEEPNVGNNDSQVPASVQQTLEQADSQSLPLPETPEAHQLQSSNDPEARELSKQPEPAENASNEQTPPQPAQSIETVSSPNEAEEDTDELKEVTENDLSQIWQWNQNVPPLLKTCMHDIISDRARSQPDAMAVQSWDGSLTYRELEGLSSTLARYLLSRGVTNDSKIPLCFEKSMWAVVAVLGVMKAGATFSLTDPSQPEARLRTIVEQTGAQLVITSVLQSELGHKIASNGQVLAISRDFLDVLHGQSTEPLPQVPSTNPMYIIFTSGSTGKPKGVIISHENYTSGAIPRAEAVGYKAHSRVFDFPSYAFDVSIDCMLCTLACGGQVCVPSEEARMNDLSGAIRNSKANMVHMTPSVARVLDADIIPSLEVLGLGGEAVSASDAAAWSQTTSLIIAYGPSECTVGCTINNTVTVSTGIGVGVGGVTWIVDPNDHNKLVPVGAVGELLIEGPLVGIGYLDEPEKTQEVFIEDPTWLTAGHGQIAGRQGRLYKTGDLVRYESNNSGSIGFVGRKDQQVKLRGQRVELAEVEHHLRISLPSGIKVAAEVIKPEHGAPTLVAFLCENKPSHDGAVDGVIVDASIELTAALANIDADMGSRVPRYMVPAAFITLAEMPSLVSGKLDRKKLRQIGCSIPRSKLSRNEKEEVTNEEPETETEKQLQKAWNKVLGDGVVIYRQSNFFSVGGDSLRAMRLVAAAREELLELTVADIFTQPNLSGMASRAVLLATNSQEEIVEFSLLEKDWDTEIAKTKAAELCDVSVTAVEDIYPCSPLQEALMALSAKVKEAYVAQRVVELENKATAERLIAAFDLAQKDCAILRTRIVQVPGRGLYQVVVKGDLAWTSGGSLDEYLIKDRDESMDLGKPLVRYALIEDATSGKVSFVLTMHHALYDGWDMPLVIERVNKAYNENTSIKRPAEFKHFIKYLANMDRGTSETYWRNQLQGATATQFPTLPWTGYQTKADSLLEVYVPLAQAPASNVTVATVIRAAWALVASQYMTSDDVVFGETLTGRNAPIIGAEEIEGPMITTVPVRIQVDNETPISEYLKLVQEQTVAQIPHEHFGLQHIRRVSPDALEACELRTGLVLHPSTDGEAAIDQQLPANRLIPAGDSEAAQEALKFNTYALMLVCSIDPKGFLVMASFDSKTVSSPIMQRALDQFKLVCQAFSEKTLEKVEQVTCLTQDDVVAIRSLINNTRSYEGLEGYGEIEGAYISNAHDSNRLAPIEAVGELLVQTKSELELAKISQPSWLNEVVDESRSGFIYKTGKLAKYNADGIITLTGNEVSKGDAAAEKQRKAAARVSATSRKQKKLQGLWSRVLRIPEEDIGLNDSFFLLGGDSIAAMKLVSEARLEGVALTVVQVFEKRSLYDMANVMEETEVQDVVVEEVQPFSLLEETDSAAFVETIVRPQLADVSFKVANVLPTRPLQEIAVKGTTQIPRFSARYELMYFDGDVDRDQLARSCQELVSRNEILRTVFVEDKGQCYGVVLEDLQAQFVEYDVDCAVDIFAKQLCGLDVLTKMPLGSSFVKWFFVKGNDGQSCLIFRLSHAQYDEMCLPILLRQLSDLYERRPVQDTVPFSSYVAHVLRKNIPSSIDYWRNLLAGSTITPFRPDIPVHKTNHFAIQQTVDISSRSRDMTVATLPTAAWALCLARHLSLRDVTFGEVVSGRNVDFPGASAVTGPCWQYSPFRVRFEPDWTVADLLAHVQHQHVASAAHEGISLREIVDQCCPEWAAAGVDWFDTVVHQDVDHVESLGTASGGRTETVYPHEEPLREWKMQAFISGDELTLELVTMESWGDYAKGLLEELAEVTRQLVREPQAKLFP